MTTFPVDFLCVKPADSPGRLALGFAPGRMVGRLATRSLELDLGSLRQDHGLLHLVCLLENHELELLGIPDLVPRAEANGLQTLHAPIPDGGTPASPEAMDALAQRILTWLDAGEGVFLHCWAGLGRTGTVAAACLIARGFSAVEALELVRKTRPGAVETPAQEQFLRDYADWNSLAKSGATP